MNPPTCPECGATTEHHSIYSSPHPTGPNRRARLGDVDLKILSWDVCTNSKCAWRSKTEVTK